MAVIDAHTHIFAPAQAATRGEIAGRDAAFAEMYGDPKAKMADAPALLAALDEAGVDGAVAAGFAFSSGHDIEEQNGYILASAGESGGRIIPLATLNPALPGWERSARRALEAGSKGFGELRPHNQGWDPLGPESAALYGLAEDIGAVLLWHVSEPLGHAYPGKRGGIAPEELAAVAAAHPGVRMIAAHLGGGLPFYMQMPEVRQSLANVYFDTAAFPLLYDGESVTRLVDLVGQDA
jgi:predicted TIM-barrel fold metal-dependent hydrolase